MKSITRFSLGMGDRFGQQGEAQLQAIIDAGAQNIEVTPVWNKSMREHTFIGTHPVSVRTEADKAVNSLNYTGAYFVDADHININNVDEFIGCSDFFTLDVADQLGRPPTDAAKHSHYLSALTKLGEIELNSENAPLQYDLRTAEELIDNYGASIEAAETLYKHIYAKREDHNFAIEISMDETDEPQGAYELLGILCMLAADNIPVQTIAPKFTGRFNKGVDYVGDLNQFRAEFEADILAVQYASKHLRLPDTLKLSVHSGSDKFSLYPIIGELIKHHNAGLHLKTAGTTWLEEAAGLAQAGGSGLAFIKKLYMEALAKIEMLAAPYATVLDIKIDELPGAEAIAKCSAEELTAMIEHNQNEALYNPSLRQLLHVAFKLAAAAGTEFNDLLEKNAELIGGRVHHNLLHKHILRIF